MKTGNKRPPSEVGEAIHGVASYLEDGGNSGEYTSYIPDVWRWVMGVRYQPERQGILFYSTGWGWRVRKNPDWRKVWQERFSSLTEVENGATHSHSK